MVYTFTVPASLISTVPEMSGNPFLQPDGSLYVSPSFADYITSDGVYFNSDVWNGTYPQAAYENGVAYFVTQPGIHYLTEQISAIGIYALALNFDLVNDTTSFVGIEVPRWTQAGIIGFGDYFAATDFESAGSYTAADGSVLTVVDPSAPEPASRLLLSLGLGVMLLTRVSALITTAFRRVRAAR